MLRAIDIECEALLHQGLRHIVARHFVTSHVKRI